MPDTDNRYRALFKKYPELADYVVIPPDIKDHNGKLILPAEYATALAYKNPTPVCVEVMLHRARGGRTYQMMIKSMHLLLPKPKPNPTLDDLWSRGLGEGTSSQASSSSQTQPSEQEDTGTTRG